MKFTGLLKYVSLLQIFLLTSGLFSQNYIWPTNSSEYLSASFCEFREGHYHSAIDIKTWNTEGYPCYAVADGFIKRIRISPFGYGKVIYLQLNDGQTAVYAHLQKFTKAVDKKIREMQFKNKRYRIDWWPKNLNVKQGDIIAYTGRSGIGVPHLHFEIRNRNDNPVNPLQYYPQIKDHIKPKLQSIAVVPMSEKTTINGNFLPQRFPLKHIKEGVYIIEEPLYVDGIIGLAVRGFDQADGVYNKYGFYQSTLEVSGKKIFRISYDELHFATTAHINTEIVYSIWSENQERYQKLYIEPFNPLPFYDRSLNTDGLIDVKDEPVPFTIEISDYKTNRSIISGELLPAKESDLEILERKRIGTQAFLRLKSPPIKDLKFYIEKQRTWQPVHNFEILEGMISHPEQGMLIKVNLIDSSVSRLRIEVNTYINRYVSLSPTAVEYYANPKVHLLGKRIIAEFPEPGSIPVHHLSELYSSVTWGTHRKPELQIVLPVNKPRLTGQSVFLDSLINYFNDSVHMLYPGGKTQVTCFDSSLVITSFDQSVTDTTLIRVQIHQSDSLSNIFPVASKIYELSPDNFPIFRSIRIQLKADSLPEWGNWAVFKLNGSDKVTFLKSEIKTSQLEFTAMTSSLGKFVIAADTVAPIVEIKSPQNGTIYQSTPKILVYLKDEISGIGDEKDISISMDGNYVLQEWDPEEDVLNGILENNLLTGNHVLSVSVRDRAGNISRQAVYFSIK